MKKFNRITGWHLHVRILFAILALVTGNAIMLLLASFAPICTPMSLLTGLTAEEKRDQEALLEKVKTEVNKEIDGKVKAINEEGKKAIEGIIEKRLEPWKEVPVDKLKGIVEDMEKANAAIADLKSKKLVASVKTGSGKKVDLLQKKLKQAWPDMVKAFEQRQSFRINLGKEVKLDNTKINSTSFGAGVVRGFREAGIDFEQLPELFILDLIQTMTGGPGSNPLSWVERAPAPVGGAGAKLVTALHPTSVAEEAAKPQLGMEWVVRTAVAQTIAALVPVTKQAVFNYPQLEAEIRQHLMTELAYVLQEQIINGDGTANTLLGINSYAKPFAAGALANTVAKANIFDVLVAAATQILLKGYIPNFALVNPVITASMNMTKTDNGTYIMPPFSTANGLNVYGMRTIGTRHITGDNFLVGDSTKSLFNWVESITIEVGMINDDFQKNIWRIRGELQGMHRIRNYEAFAFVKGDLSVAQALLDPATADS